MISLRAALGRPAIDRGSAEELGTLSHAAVDAGQPRVAGVVVGHRRKGTLYGWSQLAGFGPDAILVGADGSASVVDDIEPDAVDDATAGRFDPLGKRLLTDEGFDIGTVLDVEFDESDGTLTTLVTDRQERLDASLLRGVGSYAVVVAAPH